ncbi:Alkaline phosphatase synthesis transcriptional regulatory protein PhoP [Vibrio aerogenes CECT 7868]|uniref:Alkaline phosphatase synthesis transcriptional regulatory protein PhoP n=1 Tax=Vibrio aerogenes CECT 7868 TaxID=1216006 RepID=A0A1M5YWJ7_9VIBR|nr:response regulator [Vibrio aerogenes]SHI16234.1 Alkaline phosphatase synthesis transcriptional regulatory protein PhoP [Vibrio aerogenes CECT 7868]
MSHILIIDDDTELTSLLREVLSYEGFTVSEANDGEAGLQALDNLDKVDLVLLDVMMPKMNGTETLKKMRETRQTPVLMLTAKGEEIDRVIGLELGADDYLPKPFSDRELLARIRAILRRTQHTTSQKPSDSVEYQDLRLYPGKQEAYCKSELLDLTTTEFALLSHFVQHPGETLTKETLSMDVLGKRLAAFDRAIDMHVSNLRKKLPERPDGKPRIKTLRGRGYLMIAED